MDSFEQLSQQSKVIILSFVFFLASILLGTLVLGDTQIEAGQASVLEVDTHLPTHTMDPYAPLHLPKH